MWFNVRSLHSSSWLNVNTIATFLNTIKQFTSVCGLFIWQHVLVCFKIPLSTEVLIFQKQKIPWQIKLLWADCSLSCFSRPLAGTFRGTLLFQGSKFSSGVGFFSLSLQKSPCSEINAFQMFQGLWKHFWLARLFFKMNEEVSGWTDEVQAWRTISNDITSSLCLRPLHQLWWRQQQQVMACWPCPVLAVPHTGKDLDGLWDTSAATAQRRYQSTLAWVLHAAMMNVRPWVSGFALE